MFLEDRIFILCASSDSTKDSDAHSSNSNSTVAWRFGGIQGLLRSWVKTRAAKMVFPFVALVQERATPLIYSQKVAVLGWGRDGEVSGGEDRVLASPIPKSPVLSYPCSSLP